METAVILILIANLGILELVIKLYTEILKDKNMDKRQKED